MRGLFRRLVPEPARRMIRKLRGLDGPPQCGGMFAVYQPPTTEVFQRCKQVYEVAFRTAFEYLIGNGIRGDILEFGTYRGYSACILARFLREFNGPGRLWLYDSFEGLPPIEAEVDQQSYEVAVNKVWYSGQMALSGEMVSQLKRNLVQILPESEFHLVPGNYSETVPQMLPASPIALVHLDCGLYASTHLVLSTLLDRGLLQDGALLAFSDFNCNRASPRMGDRKALQDAFAGHPRIEYEPFFSYGWNGQVFFVHEKSSTASDSERTPHVNGDASQ